MSPELDSDLETRLRTELAAAARGPGVDPDAVRRRAARRRRRAVVRESLATALVLAALVAGGAWFNAWRAERNNLAVTGVATAPPTRQELGSPTSQPASSTYSPGFPRTAFDPATAGPREVLNYYLGMSMPGNCANAQKVMAPGKRPVLCEIKLTGAWGGPGDGAWPSATEVVYATQIEGDLRPLFVDTGRMTWFVQLRKQADGSWKVTDQGTGP